MSYVKLDKDKLMELSQRTLNWIHQSRKDRKENLIKARLEQSEQSWLRRLFRIKPMTKEEAIKSLSGYGSDVGLSAFEWIDWDYSRSEWIANGLLNACNKSADGYVMVSVEELEWLTQ